MLRFYLRKSLQEKQKVNTGHKNKPTSGSVNLWHLQTQHTVNAE